MEYTKGEWKAEIGYEDSYIVCKSELGITGIATVHKKNPMNPAIGSAAANAHLIAASPLLYEALKVVLPFALRHIPGFGKTHTYMLIDQALAKANGKEV